MNIWATDPPESIVEGVKEAVDRLMRDIEALRKKADETTGKIMPVKSCSGIFGKRYSDIGSYGSGSYVFDRSTAATISAAKADAEYKWANVRAIHAENLPAMENNKAVAEKIKLIMQNIGIKDRYNAIEYVGRKRNRESVSHNAGYILDIQRECVTEDGFESEKKDYERFLKDIDAYAASKAKEDAEKVRNAEKEADKQLALKEFAVLVQKHNLDYASDWDDVLEAILLKDKYLRLAHYLRMNRGDWSDGYDYAETGLRGFSVENEEDMRIHANISKHINNWDGDGRIFRDCEWNYDVLFGKVSEELMKDYEIASKRVDWN